MPFNFWNVNCLLIVKFLHYRPLYRFSYALSLNKCQWFWKHYFSTQFCIFFHFLTLLWCDSHQLNAIQQNRQHHWWFRVNSVLPRRERWPGRPVSSQPLSPAARSWGGPHSAVAWLAVGRLILSYAMRVVKFQSDFKPVPFVMKDINMSIVYLFYKAFFIKIMVALISHSWSKAAEKSELIALIRPLKTTSPDNDP